jgi:hypothetical protein
MKINDWLTINTDNSLVPIAKQYGTDPNDVICFRTRKDACYFAWYALNEPNFNLSKEGPYYAVQLGRFICATSWRNLSQITINALTDFIKTTKGDLWKT